MSPRRPGRDRRLVVSVCPREPGTVRLAVERGQPPRRLDAPAIARALRAAAGARGLPGRVEGADHGAVGRRTHVGTLAALPYLAAMLDASLGPRARGRSTW